MTQYNFKRTQDATGTTTYTAQTVATSLNLPLAISSLAAVFIFRGLKREALAITAGVMLLGMVWTSLRLEEALLIHPTLGLQLSTARNIPYTLFPFSSALHSLPLMRSARLISPSQLQKVVLGEALEDCAGKHYLAAIMENKGEKKVEVVFPTILPRLDDLKEVWTAAQAVVPQKQ
ncbi:hypothetical protein JCM11641_008289 [Rhodosporidiobolus odoratus]